MTLILTDDDTDTGRRRIDYITKLEGNFNSQGDLVSCRVYVGRDEYDHRYHSTVLAKHILSLTAGLHEDTIE